MSIAVRRATSSIASAKAILRAIANRDVTAEVARPRSDQPSEALVGGDVAHDIGVAIDQDIATVADLVVHAHADGRRDVRRDDEDHPAVTVGERP